MVGTLNGWETLLSRRVIELLANCGNFVQAWVSKTVAGFLVSSLGAKRKNFVTDENKFTERLSQ